MRFKNGMGAFVLAAALAFGGAVPAAGQQMEEVPQDPTVDLVIASGVENGEPVGEAETFPASIGEIYAFLNIDGAAGETLAVVWSYQGNESKKDIEVEADATKEWTALEIPEEATGEWTVEIRHGESVLTTSTFTIVAQ